MVLVKQLNDFFKSIGLVSVKQDFIELNEDVCSYSELFFHLNNPYSISGAKISIINVGDNSLSVQGNKESISSIYRIIDKRKNTLNLRDIYESLSRLLVNMDNYLFTYNSGKYHDYFLGSLISYVNIYANGFLIAKCKFLQTMNDEHVDTIPFVVEYNLNNISFIIGEYSYRDFEYSIDSLRDKEISKYISTDNNIENEVLLFNSHINESELHLRNERYLLAYISLIKANMDTQLIKGKTGIFSDKYLSNMEKIKAINFDIRNSYIKSILK